MQTYLGMSILHGYRRSVFARLCLYRQTDVCTYKSKCNHTFAHTYIYTHMHTQRNRVRRVGPISIQFLCLCCYACMRDKDGYCTVYRLYAWVYACLHLSVRLRVSLSGTYLWMHAYVYTRYFSRDGLHLSTRILLCLL